MVIYDFFEKEFVMKENRFTVTEVPFAFYRKREEGYRLMKNNRTSNGLTLILSGEMEITYPDKKETLHAGDIILQRLGDSYSLSATSQAGVEFIVISYHAEPLDRLFALLPDRLFFTEHFSRYKNAFETAARIQEFRGVCHETLLCALVQEILCNIIRESYSEVLAHKKNPVEYAKRYIEEFYGNDLSAENIAAVVGVSPSYLRSLFKKSEEESPIRYLNRVRIEHAKEMLSSKMFRLDEIALACGFQNVYYFSRVFKSFTGVPPGKY